MNIVFLTRASRQHRNNKMQFYQDIVGKKMSELGHSVTIITTSLKDRPEAKIEIDEHQIKTEFLEGTDPDVYTEKFWLDSAKRCFELYKENKLDVVIGSSLGAFGLINKPGNIKPFPLVNVFHNTFSTNAGLRKRLSINPLKIIGKIKSERKEKMIWLNRLRPLFLDSDLVVVVSNSLRKNLASDLAVNNSEKLKFESKITVIHNGIDEEKFKPVPVIKKNKLKEQILEKYGFKNRYNPLIMFIGRISSQKGLIYLIDSLYLLKKKNYEFNCIIAGRSEDGSYLQLLKSKINKYYLGDSVKVNPIGIQNVADYYAASDIVVHPSIVDEGLSYSLLESMASGCTVVITKSGGNVEAIKDGLNGLIILKKDSKSLMKAIAKIIDDPLFAEKIKANARETVLDSFTITKHVKTLLENIERIKMDKENESTLKEKSPVFISEDRKVYAGGEALELLDKKNDAVYIDEEHGITHVDLSRWQEAQNYERKTWMVDFCHFREDRNSVHMDHFDNYSVLRGQNFGRAIELGCGPFTNIRHLAKVANISQIHLLDPLIGDYLSHLNCAYNGRKLNVEQGILWDIFKMHKRIPVTVHESTIEEFETLHKFDLILMINVMEHCFDANKVFEKILEIAADRAFFIFHERYYSAKELRNELRYEYDAGHPLKIDCKLVDNFLSQNFDPILSKIVHFKRYKWGADRSYDGIYFIGKKLLTI